MVEIIKAKRSVIVAADVPDAGYLQKLVLAVKNVAGIGGFKLGFELGLQNLGAMAAIIRSNLRPNETRIIYDHQKAGNDIPDMGINFSRILKKADIDAAILFPFTGPATQEKWTKACFDAGLEVITGGVMTHSKFLVSEGGYIADEAPERIFRLACKLGVRHFVVPGNKLHWIKKLRAILVEELGEGNFTLYAPGFITQGGDISECGQAAGDNWHAIVGSAIYGKKEMTIEQMRQAAITVTGQIV